MHSLESVPGGSGVARQQRAQQPDKEYGGSGGEGGGGGGGGELELTDTSRADRGAGSRRGTGMLGSFAGMFGSNSIKDPVELCHTLSGCAPTEFKERGLWTVKDLESLEMSCFKTPIIGPKVLLSLSLLLSVRPETNLLCPP